MKLQTYSLSSWTDLQNHLNDIGKEEAVNEIKYVDKVGYKLKYKEFEILKEKFPFSKDTKNESIVKVLYSNFEELES